MANGSIGGQAIRALLLGIRAPRVLERVTRTTCFDNQGGTDVAEISCGIDWAQDHHDIAIVDADGRLVAKRPIPESVAGCAELTAMLADAGDDPKDPIPVAIETPRGLLVAALRATGRPIYPIHPMSVACYRERSSMSGNKSDHADAVTLANILRTDADQHRRLPADSELAQSITVLARAHQDATWRRTRAGNELQSLLREYFRVSHRRSPTAPAESPHPKPDRCWPLPPHRPRQRGCPSRRSPLRCAAPGANAA
jgi:transposase